jgi:hypothetical protein
MAESDICSCIPSREAVHDAAVVRHLGDVVDAYETFCAYGHLSTAWKSLSIQLALYLKTHYFGRPNVETEIPFQMGLPYAAYLEQLVMIQLGYPASDAVIALLQVNEVLLPS